jgi:hypothetical protein
MAETGFVVRFMLHMKSNYATARHGSTKIGKGIMYNLVHRVTVALFTVSLLAVIYAKNVQ